MTAQGKLAHYEGIEGWWLGNATAEAFISGTPYPRVVAFRLKVGDSPLRTSVTDPFYGIRSWFLEPVQNDQSPLPALQPAEPTWHSPRALRLTAAPDRKSGLQLVLEIALDNRCSRLLVRHGFLNLRRRSRRLAAWAISVFPHKGAGVAPWAMDEAALRSYILFPQVQADERALRLGRNAVAVDFRIPPRGPYVKIGTNTDVGWAGYVRDGLVLKSSVTHEPGAEYPEGGGTVTFYNSGRTPQQGFCEVENVGPLTTVPGGKMLWLDQRIGIAAGPKLQGRDPDTWMASIVKQIA
jgi:hypothetical protein